MMVVNYIKKYEIFMVSYFLLYIFIVLLSFFVLIPYSFSQQDDLVPLISQDENEYQNQNQDQSDTTATTSTSNPSLDTNSESLKKENEPKLTKSQLYYQKLFNAVSSKKISTPSFISLESDLIFMLYKNYLYLYTPYKSLRFKIFKDEHPWIRKIRFFFKMFQAKSYKLVYTKNNVKGAYYFSVTENGFIPYFIFLPTNKVITFKDMRDYIISYKKEWLMYNNSSWLKSNNFKKYLSKNEVYITAGSGTNYWDSAFKIDKLSIKLLENRYKSINKKNRQ